MRKGKIKVEEEYFTQEEATKSIQVARIEIQKKLHDAHTSEEERQKCHILNRQLDYLEKLQRMMNRTTMELNHQIEFLKKEAQGQEARMEALLKNRGISLEEFQAMIMAQPNASNQAEQDEMER